MTVDELSVMDGSKCILQLRGVRPFFSNKFDITKHKNYRYLSDANPKYAFDIGKFVSTKLKINPTDEYTYFEYAPPDEDIPQEAFDDFENFDPDDLEPI